MSDLSLAHALVDTHLAADNAWSSRIQQNAPHEQRRLKRAVYHQCSSSGKTGDEVLKACTLCRSVRYCNTECQNADYRGQHKRECKQFVHPPFTKAFVTVPYSGKTYPPHPVFGHGYEPEGVGCWVSIREQVETELQTLVTPLRMSGPSDGDYRYIRANRDPVTVGRYKASAHNLLTLEVLVQNRRKDKAPALFFGAQTHLLASRGPEGYDLRKGQVEGDNSFTLEVPTGGTCVAVGVSNDLWDARLPRLQVTNFNGKAITPGDAHLHEGVINPERGIVALKPGQYAIMQMQFRVGDGKTIRTYWNALSRLDSLCMPFIAPWKGDSPDAYDEVFTKERTPQGLCAHMDMATIVAFYSDAVVKGEHAFVESHYGKDQADKWRDAHLEMNDVTQALLDIFSIATGGQGIRDFSEHCRTTGNNELLEVLETMRTNN